MTMPNIEGWRKLVSALCGVGGIVLVTVYGVPPGQVDSLAQALADLAPPVVATVSILGTVWQHLRTQGRIDSAKAAQPTGR